MTLKYKSLNIELWEELVLDFIHKDFYHCSGKGSDGRFYALSIALDKKTVIDIAEI